MSVRFASPLRISVSKFYFLDYDLLLMGPLGPCAHLTQGTKDTAVQKESLISTYGKKIYAYDIRKFNLVDVHKT